MNRSKITEAKETDVNCWIGDRQTATFIEGGDLTYQEALELIFEYERQDRLWDEYDPEFYEIYVYGE